MRHIIEGKGGAAGEAKRAGKPAQTADKAVAPPQVQRVRVGEGGDGQRLDNFLLRHWKGVPKTHVYRVIRSGEVRVNGGRAAADTRLALGDELRLPPVRTSTASAARPAAPPREFPVVWEDETLIAVDKPAGVAVHGGSGVSFGVIEQLRRQRPEARCLELAHRLDRETSGLLLIAKRRPVLTRLHDLFRDGGVEKRYLALVKGRWHDPLRHVRLALHKYLTEAGERRVSVALEGKAAHSIVRLVARWENFSLVDVELKTGRTHQIRVHLAHLGFPLCGDDKYGDFELNRALRKQGLDRMFLHAGRLAFDHPVSGERLELKACLPEELLTFLGRMDHNEKRDYGTELQTGGI